MPKTIKAPKLNNSAKTDPKPKHLDNPKTYNSHKIKTHKTSPLKLITILIINIFIILLILFTLITYIQGYVFIPQIFKIQEDEISIPNKTNKKILHLHDNSLTKWQKLKITVRNSINNKEYTLSQNQTIQIPLAEGVNTIDLQKILNLRIIKFGGTNKTITTILDTTPPQLLSKPKITNQGLVLEFTEPTILKIIKPFRKTFKTDDSYTIIIPMTLIKNLSALKLEYIDKLGNIKHVELILNKKQIQNHKTNKYSKNELPKSAGLLENLNMIGTITLLILLTIPSITILTAYKIKKHLTK